MKILSQPLTMRAALSGAFSRPQVLFLICLAIVAFEIGSRVAKRDAPVVRKTTVVQTNVTPAPVVTNVLVAWPTQKETSPVDEAIASQIVTNNRAITPLRTAKSAPHIGGGRQADAMNVKGGGDKRKVPGPPQPQWPKSTNASGGAVVSPYGIRIALP